MTLARPVLALVFFSLTGIGLYQAIQHRGPDRPVGGVEDIAGLRGRDDLNVVMVLVDTLRADRLSAWGYERPTSPIMDALAASGVRFENALAQSTWTKTSMASMLTATYPVKNQIERFNNVLPNGATLASEAFQEAGFRTVGIWRNGWVGPNFGFGQGWDFYLKPTPKIGTVRQKLANPSSLKLGGTDRSIIDAATQFLRSSGDQRFFLYLHLMDVHQYVYDGSSDFGRSYSDIYDQSIHWVDANIGTLIAVLQQQGLMKKTVLAINADHGEAFLEHGTEGHAQNLYAETTHVPFILALPFRLRQPVVVRSPVENIDVVPTLLDLAGLPPLPEADGHSLVPLIEAAARGTEKPEEARAQPRFARIDRNWGQPSKPPRPLTLVQMEGYRLHEDGGGHAELYDARSDASEQTDLAETHPQVVERLRARLEHHDQTPEPSWGGPGWVQIDDMEAAQLRALGYAFDPNAPPKKRELER